MLNELYEVNHFDLFQRGYNSFGQSPLTYLGSEVNAKAKTMYEAGVPSNFIQDGDTIVRLNMIDGYLQSNGFVSGSTGWRIDSDGNVEFANGYFRGDVVGATITGSTIWAKNTGSGLDIKLGSDGTLKFYYDGTEVGQVSGSATGSALGFFGSVASIFSTAVGLTKTYIYIQENDISIKAENNAAIESKNITSLKTSGTNGQIQLLAQETGGDVVFASGENTFIYESDDWVVAYDSDNDSSECRWASQANTRMRLSTAGQVTADGSFTGGGADIAELFESIDGKAIPSGIPVILENGKVRKATEGEIPFGVVSNNATIIGNSGGSNSDTEWTGKYLRNKDGSFVKEEAEFWSIRKIKKDVKDTKQERIEIGVNQNSGWSDIVKPPKNAEKKIVQRRKINPEWDKTKKYVSRKDRDEWNIIGFLGTILIKKGSPVAEHWKFMGEENDEYDKYFIYLK